MGIAKVDMKDTEDLLETCPRRIDQVCQLAAEGLTDLEIARRLEISRHTVVNYWRRLREMYDLSNRTALVVRHLNSSVNRKMKELEDRNQFLAKQYGKLYADNARFRDASLGFDKALKLCMDVLHLAESFVFKVSAERPYKCVYMSHSASSFGLNADDFMNNRLSWFDVIMEEDIQTLMELSEKKPPSLEQDCQIFRLKAPSTKWILNIQRPYTDPSDGQEYVVGLVLNVDNLVKEGVLEGKVAQTCHLPIAKRG